jgi:hypothetical protein
MGVTIHFEGQLLSADHYTTVIGVAKTFAESQGWDYFLFQEESKLLQRVREEQDWDYEGATKGIKIQPDKDCDPLILEFDENLFLQEYCKTQFSDINVHTLIVQLLKIIQVHFSNFKVEDEGEYWDTSDTEVLEQHFRNCFRAIESAKQENPRLAGPFKLENGRIIDLMTQD